MTIITTPFHAASTAEEVVQEIDLAGKRIVITGGASGIGVETARALAGQGAEVTLAVRNLDSGLQAAADITAYTGNKNVQAAVLDLLDKRSIAAFASSWEGPLDVLINNAGVMAIPRLRRTAEGYEEQFAANYLGHFALTAGLHQALAKAHSARIVVVASADPAGDLANCIAFEDIHFQHRPYDPITAYMQSKAATVLLAAGADKRWRQDGIRANALMPGAIATNLQRHIDTDTLKSWGAADADGNRLTVPDGWKTPEQGAATSVLVAASPLLEGVGGRFFIDCRESDIINAQNGHIALDAGNADLLWDTYFPVVSSWLENK
ncbi:SDR family NAD(P)-dependent oxidoreductase [Paenibacillus jilunlii]|uniref:Probable oxidoreductase n=1 Tax=Paenibacillus jilunlii TaxID=682956 RepID=A0A1G9WXR8_9BACL|nr:SDR family NAD(P)-dependent oxidoreductase [Paenibacillus jilunlii]KWX76468.1 oxidoreductase [Paenibacillus jilunlii]SDM89257.1 NAD(P)-dependent dehydrogenase, short-chain alcohol dehydrogenase family [Paenibacillus jilunlii]